MKLLLVEDNVVLSSWLARLLRKDNYAVDCCFDGDEAEEALRNEDYALVILDLCLPKMGGLEVLKRFRARGATTPVLILTVNDAIADRVAGLDGGADDYLVKPFEIEELEARIRAQLRRSLNGSNPLIKYGRLSFDPCSRHFALDDQTLRLTPRERAILEALILKAGSPCSKAMLVKSVFSFDDEADPSAIEIYVHRLRKKLDESGLEISTIRGLGYALIVSSQCPREA
jgi:two-component system, OmpR family, response regulator TctD